jgi:SulP family sulfate permease
LTVAVVALPQSMAYAIIAGLPVQYGLYASIVPTIIGCLWGSSAHLITGPTTTASLVVFSALSSIAQPGSLPYIELAFVLAAMAGIIRIAMGMARLGVLLNFISHSVLLGFTSGAAVLIIFKQLPSLLDIHIEKGSGFIRSLLDLIVHLGRLHPLSFVLGLIVIAVVLAIKRWRPGCQFSLGRPNPHERCYLRAGRWGSRPAGRPPGGQTAALRPVGRFDCRCL